MRVISQTGLLSALPESAVPQYEYDPVKSCLRMEGGGIGNPVSCEPSPLKEPVNEAADIEVKLPDIAIPEASNDPVIFSALMFLVGIDIFYDILNDVNNVPMSCMLIMAVPKPLSTGTPTATEPDGGIDKEPVSSLFGP
jgi:hypothetical protein